MVKKLPKQIIGLAKALPVDKISCKKTIDKTTRNEMEQVVWKRVNKMMNRHSCRYSDKIDRVNFPKMYKDKIRHMLQTKFTCHLDENGDFDIQAVDDTNFDFFCTEVNQMYDQWKNDLDKDASIPYTPEQLVILKAEYRRVLETSISEISQRLFRIRGY